MRSAEAYRSLRSTIKFAPGPAPIRSVLVVDIDRPTASDVAERLADAFAEAADRCLLVLTDSRSGAGDEAGLADLMRAEGGGSSIVSKGQRSPEVIGPGRDPSPDLLAGAGFEMALEALLASTTYVILSAAPLPVYADALAIAPRVDAVILVVTAGRTRRARAVEAREALERVGARLLGVVLVEQPKRKFW
jgi:non-specific protein-tyrosine kinase